MLLAGAGYLYYLTTQFDEPSALLGENVGPADFPRLVIYFIAILAVILPFESRLQPERWQKIWEGRHKPVNALTWLSIGFLFAVSLAAPYLGTIITMLLVSRFAALALGRAAASDSILSFAILFTLAVTWVFNVILKVYFEPGIFQHDSQAHPILLDVFIESVTHGCCDPRNVDDARPV